MLESAPRPADIGGSTTPGSGRPSLRLVVALGALASFAPLSLDMYLPSLPALRHDLGISASATQLTITACLAGLALGQLIAGPASDRFGRRRPLVAGVGLYALASALCALAPSAGVLVPMRLLQGLAGSAGIVISRAFVRDLYTGEAAGRAFAALLVVNGAAPIVAPVIGGQLLGVTTWRGIFVVLTGIGVVLLAAAARLPETLPPARRRAGGLVSVARTLREVAGDRGFVGYGLAGGLVMGAMFSYIAGSPFALQTIYGLSPQAFSAVFAVNGLGIVLASLLTGKLIPRVRMRRLAAAAIGAAIGGSCLVLAAVLDRGLGVAPVLAGLFVVVSTVGVVFPTTTTLALSSHGAVAGSASALLGVLQYLLGAVAAPLVGVAGSHTAVPMAVLMLACTLGALLALTAVRAAGARLAG